MAATVFASSFASALELVREGEAEIHQKEAFSPLFMRKRVGVGAGEDVTGNSTAPDNVQGNA
jgi:segregation and condensation protein A